MLRNGGNLDSETLVYGGVEYCNRLKGLSELGVSMSRLKNICESHIFLPYIVIGTVASSFKGCGLGVALCTSLHFSNSHFFTPVQIAHIHTLLNIRVHPFFKVVGFRGDAGKFRLSSRHWVLGAGFASAVF